MQSFHTRPHGIRHMIPCEHIHINYFGEHTLLKVWSRYVCDDLSLQPGYTVSPLNLSLKKSVLKNTSICIFNLTGVMPATYNCQIYFILLMRRFFTAISKIFLKGFLKVQDKINLIIGVIFHINLVKILWI